MIAPPVYQYAGEYSIHQQSSVTATLPVTNPSLSARDWHSNAEVAVQNYNQKSMVEAGWLKQPGDSGPRLFTSWWRGGAILAYKDCGPVKTGRAVFSIKQEHGAWVARYGSRVLKSWPDSNWGTAFRHATVTQAFAEVESRGGDIGAMTHGRVDYKSVSPVVFGNVSSHSKGHFTIRGKS